MKIFTLTETVISTTMPSQTLPLCMVLITSELNDWSTLKNIQFKIDHLFFSWNHLSSLGNSLLLYSYSTWHFTESCSLSYIYTGIFNLSFILSYTYKGILFNLSFILSYIYKGILFNLSFILSYIYTPIFT